MRRLYLVASIIAATIGIFADAIAADSPDSIYVRVAPARYRIRREATIKTDKSDAVVYLPLPADGPAHDIEKLSHTEGEIVEIHGSPGEKRVKISIPPGERKGVPVFVEFEAVTWGCKVDFDKIAARKILPYDKDSELYRQYTKQELPFFDPEHEKVRKAVAAIGSEAVDDLDFARRAYFHAIEAITLNGKAYLAPVPLADTLKDMKGSEYHCGNYLVSILRGRGIPARNVFALTVSGRMRRWIEFYLEGCGWIPLHIRIKNESNHVTPESWFGLAVEPPYWFDRQPYSVVMGYTDMNHDIPGAQENRNIKRYTSNSDIYLGGGREEKSRLIIEALQ